MSFDEAFGYLRVIVTAVAYPHAGNRGIIVTVTPAVYPWHLACYVKSLLLPPFTSFFQDADVP